MYAARPCFQTVFCLNGSLQCCVRRVRGCLSVRTPRLIPTTFAQLLRSLTHPTLFTRTSSPALLLRPPPRLAFAQVAELTQIPLTLVDACRAFKPLRTMIPTVNSVSRIAFALSFLALRLIAWPIVR